MGVSANKSNKKANPKIKYKTIKKIGKGGFGEVYLIEKDNKEYALKKISILEYKLTEKQIEEYKEKIKCFAALNSNNIIKYYDSFVQDDYFNILMEYGGDSNLKQFIQKYKIKNQFIEEKIIKQIINQLYFGLKEIHNNKIIHRDLKPENIIINKKNKIKIGDFSISKILTTNSKYGKTKIGTLFYTAPEIIKGDKYDNRVDIYSLGCIIYELFTLNEYYIDKTIDQKECKINNDIYDKGWQNIIDSLLKKDYKERPIIKDVYTIAKSNNIILNNEILLTININKDDIGKQIYFLDNTEYKDDFGIKHKHYNLMEMNEENTELYINDFKYKFKKYFIPEKEGLYTIKIILNFNIKNCRCMFKGCLNLESIDLSLFDTQNVMDMSEMFSSGKPSIRSNLKMINLSSLDTKYVTSMNTMFLGCSSLQSIDLSSFNTKNVTDMFGMFFKCFNLKSIDLSSFDTKNVNDMSFMFCECYDLKSINLSSFDTKNVTDMQRMFYNCCNLESIDLSSFDTKNVTDMSNMFCECINLESINLSSFDTKNVTNMDSMFALCSNNLKRIDLSSFDTKNVTNMDSMFSGCFHLESINISSFNTENVTNLKCMFYECFHLESIDLSSFDTKNVIDMSCMFCRCSDLKYIDLSSFDIKNITDINRIFEKCSNLKKIKIKKLFFEKIIKDNPDCENEYFIKNAIIIDKLNN